MGQGDTARPSAAEGADTPPKTAPSVPGRHEVWGVVVDGRECTYFDYYAGAATQPQAQADTSAGGGGDREPPTAFPPAGREGIDLERKRDYTETLFRGLVLHMRQENASRLQATFEGSLAALTGVASGAPLAVAREGSAEKTEPLLPVGDLKDTLDRLDALAAQQVETTHALEKYLAIESELRKAVLAAFVVAERERIQRERTRIVEELDSSIHYALHALRADQELLQQDLAPSADDTPSGVFRKLERALTTMSRPGTSKRLQELRARIAVVTGRQRLLVERRDAMNRELSRLDALLQDLGFGRETTAWAVHARGLQQGGREEGLRSALSRSAGETVRLARGLGSLLDRHIVRLASLTNETPTPHSAEQIAGALSSFLPVAGLRLYPDQLGRLHQEITRLFRNAQSLVTRLSASGSVSGLSDQVLASLSSKPEVVFVEYSGFGAGGPVDAQTAHEEVTRWFETAHAQIRNRPQDPIEAFAEFLHSAAPAVLRAPLTAEIEELRRTLWSS